MADLMAHNSNMSKSSPSLGHMHVEANEMTNGYAGAFQFWRSKEQDMPQATKLTVSPAKQPESPTLGPRKASRLSMTSTTSSTNSSHRDPSPFNLYSSTLQEIDEEDENSSGISRERSYSIAAMPGSSSPDLNPNKRKAEVKLGCSMDEIEELDEYYELDKPISGTSSSSSMPLSTSTVSNGEKQVETSPKKIERKLRPREASASVPKLVLAHSASAADSSLFNSNTRHKLSPTPAALSARQAHRKGLSHSDTGGSPLSPKPKFIQCSNFRGIKNFNVPLHELPNVKEQASIPQLLHDCVGFLRRSDIDLNTIIDAQRKNVNNPEWNELEATLIEKKAVIDFSTLDNSDSPLVIQMVKWFFIHLPESILTNYRLRAFKDALDVEDDRVCTNMLQTLIHSLPEQNFLIVRFMIEFFKMLVSMLSKGVNSPPTSVNFDGPLSSSSCGSPLQSRPGYKLIIEKIFAAFYPMFLCHPESDEPFDLPNNNNQADAGPGSGSGYQAAARLESESNTRSRKKSHESKKEKRRSLAIMPAHKKEEYELQLMGLAPSSASSPSFNEVRKKSCKSDDFGYNKISNVKVTNEKLFQKGNEALEKRLFFLLITQYEKIFLCDEYGIEFSKQQTNITVASGDPERLVALLLDPFYCNQDKNYIDQFLMTHEYFITKEALLACLVNDLRKRTGVKPWESKHRERILLRIKQWTNQEGLSIVKDRAFLTIMRKTLKDISFKATTTVTEKELIESALMTLLNIQRTYDAMTLRRESAILNATTYELNIKKHSASVLAQQMTLLDRQLIKTICGSEFLRGAHMKAELSPNYHQMVQKFNQISNWVAHQIVSQSELSERVDTLRYFIKLTKELVALSNYNSAYAVYLGLSMQIVTRLTLTWDKLHKKHASTSLRHKKLARLFDMNFNFHEYRKSMDADKEKCPIPVLALIPKDIIRFETDSTLTKNDQVDMEKMRGIWQAYFFLRQSQNNINISSIQRVEDVFRFLSDSSFEVSEKELNKLSKKCEPKNSKITKKASVH